MKGRKTLVKNAKIADQQLKDFILEVVNAPDRQVDGSDDYLASRHRQFFPTRDRDIQLLGEVLSRLRDPNHPAPNDPFDQKEAGEMLCRGVIGELRNRLRAVWLAGDEDVAERRLFRLLLHIHSVTDFENRKSRHLYPPSPDTPIEQAVDWVRRNLLMLHVCRNPECPRPFFVTQRAQRRFCLECVSASQKAHKRRWWREKKRLQEEPKMKADARIVPTKRSGTPSREAVRKLKQFLHDIVNAHENNFDYILKVYAEAGFLPSKTISEQAVALSPDFLTPEELLRTTQQERRQVVKQLSEGLRSLWNADDQYTARWGVFNLQNKLYPPVDRLAHKAFDYLRRKLHMLRTCENPACQTPLFIADKGGQTHCSDICGRWGQKKAKARWWKQEGPKWRKRRRLQQKKSRRSLMKPR